MVAPVASRAAKELPFTVTLSTRCDMFATTRNPGKDGRGYASARTPYCKDRRWQRTVKTARDLIGDSDPAAPTFSPPNDKPRLSLPGLANTDKPVTAPAPTEDDIVNLVSTANGKCLQPINRSHNQGDAIVSGYDVARHAGTGRHRGLLSLRCLVIRIQGACSGQALRRPGQRVEGHRGRRRSAKLLIEWHAPHPEYSGRTLEEVAKSKGVPPTEMLIRIMYDRWPPPT
jgi:hypothetical protein